MLVKPVFCFLHSKAYITGVARAELMLALEVDPHVVSLVGDVATESARELAIFRSIRIGGHHICRTENQFWKTAPEGWLGHVSLCL